MDAICMRPEKQLTERANPDSFSRTQSTFRFVFFPASPQFARTWESWNPSPHSGEMRLQVLSRVAAVRQNVGELEPKPALWRDAATTCFGSISGMAFAIRFLAKSALARLGWVDSKQKNTETKETEHGRQS
jgi:hypothetical protein